ncbi:protein-L-isoaspartate(D-aspartate) O-methyltransferase [Dehalobacterium formicoaceticum]|uniref:Protein-L-isoaspartate O-methyltransferase n=1 Tax=Dehalobacterium formicoaceticum TaxID=51515 RepID=A0ABT1Y659_9FIRM|nr:protein-L-isoaspartate(D-aspartate) O-methyltransferase [Dehalobacterium formicoaceticum]MCR6546363.1 protein-L-isoaspartate(D-aspartate) O-methyltransferase [Dehalobacterium formicoaceticum]
MNYHDLLAFYGTLDRSYFIDNENKKYAHMDQALPIGHEQTISQPSLVLKMTEELNPDKTCKVLEIGTGSGYQTALLAEFSQTVFTMERIKELSEKAMERLGKLGYSNIFFAIGDGSEGWKEHAPYDRIMVTAAAEKIPDELVNQLKPGGRMIIPVGPQGNQELKLITKDSDGTMHDETLLRVTFVEMKGKYGWESSAKKDK